MRASYQLQQYLSRSFLLSHSLLFMLALPPCVAVGLLAALVGRTDSPTPGLGGALALAPTPTAAAVDTKRRLGKTVPAAVPSDPMPPQKQARTSNRGGPSTGRGVGFGFGRFVFGCEGGRRPYGPVEVEVLHDTFIVPRRAPCSYVASVQQGASGHDQDFSSRLLARYKAGQVAVSIVKAVVRVPC